LLAQAHIPRQKKPARLACSTERPNSAAALRPRQPRPAYRSAAEQRICRSCFWFTARQPYQPFGEFASTAPNIAYLLGAKGRQPGNGALRQGDL